MSRARIISSSRKMWVERCIRAFLAVALVTATSSCKRDAESLGQTCVDLSKYYNATLTDSLNSPAQVKENNFANLPKGRQVFSGVPFEVQGILVLSGKKNLEWGRKE